MIGKFLLGTALGAVVGVTALGLAVKISEVPEDVTVQAAGELAVAEPAVRPDAAQEVQGSTDAPEKASAPETAALAPSATQPEAQITAPTDAATPAPAEPDAPDAAPPQIAGVTPEPLAQMEPSQSLPEPPVAPSEIATAEVGTVPEAVSAPAAPEAAPEIGQSDALSVELPPLTPEEEALLAEMAAAALANQGLAPETIAQTMPEVSSEAAPEAASRQPAMAVDAAKPEPLAETAAAEGAQIPVAPAANPRASAVSPLVEFAQPFVNEREKPLFSVVLIDTGEEGLDRQSFADIPLSVSFAIDPSAPKAAEHAALYRAAGREVIMLLPAESKVEDLAQYAQTLPQSIVVMEGNRRQFQSDRAKSEAFVPAIADQGRGLLTWESQTNLADQLAKREGLPSAAIFRPLDSDNEAAPVIRRYLDRAAFKADHDGSVVVLGHTRPETIKALIEWSIEGRSANVSLAPLSAVLTAEIKAKP